MVRTLGRHSAKLLTKIYRIWRREGIRGFYARWRYPRIAVTPLAPLALPFQIRGGAAEQRRDLGQALQQVLGAAAVSDDQGSVLLIDPKPGEVQRGDILLLTKADATEALRRAPTDLAKAGSILLSDPQVIVQLEDAGADCARLFVIPQSASVQDLAAALSRWLIAAQLLDPTRLDVTLFPALAGLHPGARLCLGLPEATARRAGFLSHELPGFSIFDGVRMAPGWVGCGWSYASMARAALARDAYPVTIAEDDLQPPDDFQSRLAEVERYLAQEDWDIFSGLLSDISEDAVISHVEMRNGTTFIHLNFATGMVFNLYNRRVLAHLAEWRPENGGPEVNTIDAWLSFLPDLKVITTLPFLVGHDENLTSTVFGFSNRRYEGTIQSSTLRLQKMVDDYVRSHRD